MSTHKKLNEKQVWRFFTALGNSPEAIASKLKAKDIVGQQGESESCPLANAASQHFGVDFVVDGTTCGVGVESFPIPIACTRFVRKFDAGMFPGLVEEP